MLCAGQINGPAGGIQIGAGEEADQINRMTQLFGKLVALADGQVVGVAGGQGHRQTDGAALGVFLFRFAFTDGGQIAGVDAAEGVFSGQIHVVVGIVVIAFPLDAFHNHQRFCVGDQHLGVVGEGSLRLGAAGGGLRLIGSQNLRLIRSFHLFAAGVATAGCQTKGQQQRCAAKKFFHNGSPYMMMCVLYTANNAFATIESLQKTVGCSYRIVVLNGNRACLCKML